MSRKTHVKADDINIESIYANWFTILVDLIQPKDFYGIAGRATAKTSEIIAKRSIHVVEDMPRSRSVFVSDTYVNAMRNVVPTLIEGWNREGWKEGIHYVTDKRPPNHFKLNYKPVESFKHTISIYNGCMFSLGSLDQPSGLAGDSFQHIFGDEARLLKFQKLKKLNPAIRGEYAQFGHSVFYRGRTFTTDMPNILDGDEDWIMQHEKDMDLDQVKLALNCALVLNEINIELYNAQKDNDKIKVEQLRKNLGRWRERWIRARKDLTFFYVVSSFVNVDVLTQGFFKDSLKALGIEEFKSAILSFKVNLTKGEKFYGNLGEHHFFEDGTINSYYDKFGILDTIEESSLALRYIDHNQELEAGVDFGGMCSMVTAQPRGEYLYLLKEFHTLAPENEIQLGKQYREYYKYHKLKKLKLYYDRSGNQNANTKRDWASALKKAIEYDEFGNSTGWYVELMSVGQGTILQEDEYNFVKGMMGETVKGLPKLKIDKFNCKCTKSSIELTKIDNRRDRTGASKIYKDKSSEKLAMHLRPMYSTNYSDAFKYLVMRIAWTKFVTSAGEFNMSDPTII
jgi:hypothetical protein